MGSFKTKPPKMGSSTVTGTQSCAENVQDSGAIRKNHEEEENGREKRTGAGIRITTATQSVEVMSHSFFFFIIFDDYLLFLYLFIYIQSLWVHLSATLKKQRGFLRINVQHCLPIRHAFK